MKTLIVYYSLEGNTEYAASRIAAAAGADLLRIEPAKQYPDKGFKKFFWGGKSAVMAETPDLKPYAFEPEDYGRECDAADPDFHQREFPGREASCCFRL